MVKCLKCGEVLPLSLLGSPEAGAAVLGSRSGARLTPEQRKERARNAVAARWAKRDLGKPAK